MKNEVSREWRHELHFPAASHSAVRLQAPGRLAHPTDTAYTPASTQLQGPAPRAWPVSRHPRRQQQKRMFSFSVLSRPFPPLPPPLAPGRKMCICTTAKPRQDPPLIWGPNEVGGQGDWDTHGSGALPAITRQQPAPHQRRDSEATGDALVWASGGRTKG